MCFKFSLNLFVSLLQLLLVASQCFLSRTNFQNRKKISNSYCCLNRKKSYDRCRRRIWDDRVSTWCYLHGGIWKPESLRCGFWVPCVALIDTTKWWPFLSDPSATVEWFVIKAYCWLVAQEWSSVFIVLIKAPHGAVFR